jgi:sporulation protein YlmC with PRC-barrel domain
MAITTPTGSIPTGEGARIVGAQYDDDREPGPGPEIMAADTLEGDDVVNRQGEDLGKIKDIMIDVPRGRVAYAVLSSGGFLGIGDKYHAIPWSALTLDADRKCFILDVDKERLQNAPGFDKDNWPSMADTTWATEVHQYYGQRTYWTPPEL